MRRRTLLPLMLLGGPAALAGQTADTLAPIAPQDNRLAAGTLSGDVLALDLDVGTGAWRPEADQGPALVVHAFGVAGQPLTIPGPLIRVRQGAGIEVRVRNRIGAPLVVHGLHDRPATGPDTLLVPAGATRTVRFRAGAPGTYSYWATTTGAAIEGRRREESQLGGAIIVDPASGPASQDRVFVISLWTDPDRIAVEGGIDPAGAVVVNGLSWPHTERLRYAAGDTVRWRWINLSDRPHPMHLHGSYFDVASRGDGVSDTVYAGDRARLAVTETMPPGGTFTLRWIPERPGNWLFHCHTLAHIGPRLRRGRPGDPDARQDHGNHARDVMSGLVVGAEVASAGRSENPEAGPIRRAIRLVAATEPGRYGAQPGFGYLLEEGNSPPGRPGPPLILTRGEPVAINVVNRLGEPTSVHWHGIELESYYDGVSGWSGVGTVLAPAIMPGDSFVAHMTPPRAGTFIYHTHFEEERQLAGGLYGPLLVLEPGTTYDPRFDKILLLSDDGPGPQPRVLLGGRQAPEIELEAGATVRLRLISIAQNGVREVSLLAGDRPAEWRPLAKDGADLPRPERTVRPARQRIGVGETYDFEFTPDAPGALRLEVRQRGALVLAGLVKVVGAR